MRFFTALKACANGFPIHRSGWPNLEIIIEIGEDGYFYRSGHSGGRELFTPSPDDLAAWDWELPPPQRREHPIDVTEL